MLTHRPSLRRLVPVLAAATLAGCADAPLAPTPRGAAPSASIAADAFGLDPAFIAIGANGFQEEFTHIPGTPPPLNTPIAPIPWEPGSWSVVRHQRDPGSWYKIEPLMAWHGTMCERPDDPTLEKRTHHVEEYRDMVFLCRNHMMTATNASGYGVNYVTPARLVDFSTGTAVVRFDVATLRETGRDWIDLWVTPYHDNLVAPLDDSLPDLQGEPRRAVHVRMTAERARSAFEAAVVRNHVATRVPSLTSEGYETAFAARGLAPSATRRDTFELHISRTRIKFGMPRYNLWWVDAPVADLGWSQGIIQLGHHSFNPAGDGGSATTWHWDNIGAAPASPFTILRTNRRFVDASTPNGEVTFATAAPTGAFLRGAGIGVTEVSFAKAAGKFGTWQRVRLQAQKRLDPTRFASGWMPVPAGTTRVRFRPVRGLLPLSNGLWMVRDIEIWSAPQAAPAPAPADDDDDDDDDDGN